MNMRCENNKNNGTLTWEDSHPGDLNISQVNGMELGRKV